MEAAEPTLSNFNLLNDEVAHNLNSETRRQRMEEASNAAARPSVQEQERDNVIPMPNMPNMPNMQNPNANQNPNQNPNQNNMNPNFQRPQAPQYQTKPQNQQESNDNDDDDYEENYTPQKNANEDKKSNANGVAKSSSDKKILGMKPVVFYGLTALAIGVAGYFTWRHFKNKSGKTIKAPTKVNGSEVTEVASETAKAAASTATSATTKV